MSAPDPHRTQAIVNTLAAQRNAALDQVVNLTAEIAALQARLSMLEAVNKQLIEVTRPVPPPPPPPPLQESTREN